MKCVINASLLCLLLILCLGCRGEVTVSKTVSRAGVAETKVEIPVGSDGLTVEQRNVSERIKMDNAPGSIKHLYVFSAYSGQAIFYSTVKGKVTSSGKRLSPYQVPKAFNTHGTNGGLQHVNVEAIQDDGTYGSSVEYIYFWDQRGIYHQHYISGGQIVHVSSEPMPVKSIIVNVEAVKHEQEK